MLPAEIFLSHSSVDRQFANGLAEMLRRHDLPVWYSDTNITGAQQWHDEIGAALRRCDWFLLVLSPDSVTSMWVKRETLYALQQPRYENRIVPILFRDCDADQLSWTLSSLQWVDFRNDLPSGNRDLLRIWGLGYKR